MQSLEHKNCGALQPTCEPRGLLSDWQTAGLYVVAPPHKGDDSRPGQGEWEGRRFHHTTQMACNLKLTSCSFLEFSIQYFWTVVDHR